MRVSCLPLTTFFVVLVYYRHKEAGMLDSRSVARALATAEMRFILISSVLFCLVFIPVSGIDSSAELKRRAAQGIGVSLVINSFTVLDIFPRPDSNLSPGHQGFWGFFTFNAASKCISSVFSMMKSRNSDVIAMQSTRILANSSCAL